MKDDFSVIDVYLPVNEHTSAKIILTNNSMVVQCTRHMLYRCNFYEMNKPNIYMLPITSIIFVKLTVVQAKYKFADKAITTPVLRETQY